MKNLQKFKAFEISKETSKKIAGGRYPTFAEQQCWAAQAWISANNFYRCRSGRTCAGTPYLRQMDMFC